MGHIFTVEDVKEGRIPSPEDYRKAILFVREELRKLCLAKVICSANLHGSNLTGDGGVGSDLDVLVITNSQKSEDELRRIYQETKNQTKVTTEFVPIQKNLAQRGLHSLDSLYASYMREFCREGVVGINPFEIISEGPSWNNRKQEISDRLAEQLKKFAKTNSTLPKNYNEEYYHFLEKILRQPIYSAIDLIRLESGRWPSNEEGKPLSKRDICNLYGLKFHNLKENVRNLEIILSLREEYREFLGNERSGAGNSLMYPALLRKIENLYPAAISVIKTNLDVLNS